VVYMELEKLFPHTPTEDLLNIYMDIEV